MGLIFLTLVFFQAIQYNKLSEAQRLRSCPEIRSRRSTSHRDRPRPHPRTTIRAGVEETQGAEAPTKPLSSHLLGGQKCKLLHAVISSQRVYTCCGISDVLSLLILEHRFSTSDYWPLEPHIYLLMVKVSWPLYNVQQHCWLLPTRCQ